MKNIWVQFSSVIITSILLTGCVATRQDLGLIAGGVAGGAAGNILTGGSTLGTAVGAVGGAFAGRQLAR